MFEFIRKRVSYDLCEYLPAKLRGVGVLKLVEEFLHGYFLVFKEEGRKNEAEISYVVEYDGENLKLFKFRAILDKEGKILTLHLQL